MNITSLSFTVAQPMPQTIQAVLACNKLAFDALLPANLSDPTTSSLPPPLLDLSCFPDQGQTVLTNCTRVFPANRRLRPQQMCILVKNAGPQPVTVNLQVAWSADAAGNLTNVTNSSGVASRWAQSTVVTASLATVLAGAALLA
jgi:hypothetical protein